jgi:CDP-diacylglycerol--glycerol-3-phosphate 3-phosphatidyltransferase
MGLTLANKVTIGRILVVPLLIATLLYYSSGRDYLRWVSLTFFLIAVISDVIDGYIARRYYQKTKAGAILDPLADKLLLVSAFTCLYIVGENFPLFHFPVWFVVIMISRDAILLLGALIIQLTTGRFDLEANIYGKITAFVQTLCLIGMLVQWTISQYLWPAAVVLTIISGLLYIREGIKVINDSAV